MNDDTIMKGQMSGRSVTLCYFRTFSYLKHHKNVIILHFQMDYAFSKSGICNYENNFFTIYKSII